MNLTIFQKQPTNQLIWSQAKASFIISFHWNFQPSKPPQRCHNPPSHRCEVITSSWCVLTDDGLSVGVCCQQSNGKRLGGKGEKEPSQKEISSSNRWLFRFYVNFLGRSTSIWGWFWLRVIGFSLFLQWYPTIRKPCLSRASEKSIGDLGWRKRSRFHQFQCR